MLGDAFQCVRGGTLTFRQPAHDVRRQALLSHAAGAQLANPTTVFLVHELGGFFKLNGVILAELHRILAHLGLQSLAGDTSSARHLFLDLIRRGTAVLVTIGVAIQLHRVLEGRIRLGTGQRLLADTAERLRNHFAQRSASWRALQRVHQASQRRRTAQSGHRRLHLADGGGFDHTGALSLHGGTPRHLQQPDFALIPAPIRTVANLLLQHGPAGGTGLLHALSPSHAFDQLISVGIRTAQVFDLLPDRGFHDAAHGVLEFLLVFVDLRRKLHVLRRGGATDASHERGVIPRPFRTRPNQSTVAQEVQSLALRGLPTNPGGEHPADAGRQIDIDLHLTSQIAQAEVTDVLLAAEAIFQHGLGELCVHAGTRHQGPELRFADGYSLLFATELVGGAAGP